MGIDFSVLQSELLRAIRKKTSQAHLSKKLKFHSNRIHRWESGKAAIPWRDFCRLCVLQGVPLGAACRRVLGFKEAFDDTGKFSRHLAGNRTNSLIAARLGVSPSMVSRWKAGKVEPSLVQVLRLVQVSVWSLSEFVDQLVPGRPLPSLRSALQREREAKILVKKHPWIAALLLLLRTSEYKKLPKHQEGYLAKKLAIPLEAEIEVTKRLLDAEVIRYERGRLVPVSRSLDTSGDPESDRKIRQYWAERSLFTIRKALPDWTGNNWGYMVLNTNPHFLEKFRALYFAFFQDVSKLVTEAEGEPEGVHYLGMQFLDLKNME